MTTAEQARNRVDEIVTTALERCMDQLDGEISAGRFTEQHVSDVLRGFPDLAAAWADWRADGSDQ